MYLLNYFMDFSLFKVHKRLYRLFLKVLKHHKVKKKIKNKRDEGLKTKNKGESFFIGKSFTPDVWEFSGVLGKSSRLSTFHKSISYARKKVTSCKSDSNHFSITTHGTRLSFVTVD